MGHLEILESFLQNKDALIVNETYYRPRQEKPCYRGGGGGGGVNWDITNLMLSYVDFCDFACIKFRYDTFYWEKTKSQIGCADAQACLQHQVL